MDNDLQAKPGAPEPPSQEAWTPADEPESQRELEPWQGTTSPGQRFTQPFPAPWRKPTLSR